MGKEMLSRFKVICRELMGIDLCKGLIEGRGMDVEWKWFRSTKRKWWFRTMRVVLNLSSVSLIVLRDWYKDADIGYEVYVTIVVLSSINGIYLILYLLMIIMKVFKTILKGEWIVRNSPRRGKLSIGRLISYTVKGGGYTLVGIMTCLTGSVGIDEALKLMGKDPIILPTLGKLLNVEGDRRSTEEKMKVYLDIKNKEDKDCRDELLKRMSRIEKLLDKYKGK